MHLYFKNNPAKFHPNLIWNNGALGFFAQRRPNKNNNNNKISSDTASVAEEENKKINTDRHIRPTAGISSLGNRVNQLSTDAKVTHLNIAQCIKQEVWWLHIYQ